MEIKVDNMSSKYVVVALTLLAFVINGAIAYKSDYYALLGFAVIISRGAALAIMLLCALLLLLVSYDLLTILRRWSCPRRILLSFLDHNVLLHRICGDLLVIYSIIHVLGHAFGSILVLHREEDLEAINLALTHKSMDRHLNYGELLFTTIPGITGLLLLLILLVLFVTSLESVRRKKYQLFANVHVFLVPTFLVLLILHGSDGWLNDGYPFSLWFVVAPLLLYA